MLCVCSLAEKAYDDSISTNGTPYRDIPESYVPHICVGAGCTFCVGNA